MDKRKEANLRVKKKITDALFLLMHQKKFSDITVTEIIEKAQVARASYYRNYSSKEEVLTKLIAAVLEDFKMKSGFEQSDYLSYEIVRSSFCYFKQYGNYVLDLYHSGFASRLLEELNGFHELNVGTMPVNSIEKYQLYMYIGALFNTGVVWLENGAKESVEDISAIFCKYVGIG